MALSLAHTANGVARQAPLTHSLTDSLQQLSKILLSRYSCDSAMVAESDSSSSGTDSLHQLSKGLLSHCSRISFHQLSKGLLSRSYYDSADSAESNSHLEPTLDTYVQPQDSVEGLSLTHTQHSAESQQKKVVESGTPQTAPGLRRRLQLSLAHFTRHRDSAEGCS